MYWVIFFGRDGRPISTDSGHELAPAFSSSARTAIGYGYDAAGWNPDVVAHWRVIDERTGEVLAWRSKVDWYDGGR